MKNHHPHEEDEPTKPPPPTTTTTTTTPMVQNPITKRNIQLGGPTYKELLNAGGWVQHEGTVKRLDLAALRTYQSATKSPSNENNKNFFQHETRSNDSNEDSSSRGPEKWYCITPVVVLLEDETVSSSSTTPRRRRPLSPEEAKLLQEQLLFVHKPSGMNCVPSRDDLISLSPLVDNSSSSTSSSSLASQISAYFGETAKPCHRLDRDTSGIVVFGRTAESHRDVSKQFEQRTTTKFYTALIAGCPLPNSIDSSSSLGQVVDLPIGKVPTKEGFNRWAIGGDKPRQAITHWRVEKTFTIQGAMYSKVVLEPKTGRGHQLRLHMKALGCPILGDTIHGNNNENYDENENDDHIHIGSGVATCAPRLCLHAHTLQVDWNGLRLEAESVSPF
jgi:tRNA pseudouridine32 synthase / 23S rRNA pseudouridine746 synthase